MRFMAWILLEGAGIERAYRTKIWGLGRLFTTRGARKNS
jgi:hypothetical protein